MIYPQFRKLDGFQRYYKILDDTHFTEAFPAQGTIRYTQIHALQYPEMLRIRDMMNQEWNYREMSAEEISTWFPEK